MRRGSDLRLSRVCLQLPLPLGRNKAPHHPSRPSGAQALRRWWASLLVNTVNPQLAPATGAPRRREGRLSLRRHRLQHMEQEDGPAHLPLRILLRRVRQVAPGIVGVVLPSAASSSCAAALPIDSYVVGFSG